MGSAAGCGGKLRLLGGPAGVWRNYAAEEPVPAAEPADCDFADEVDSEGLEVEALPEEVSDLAGAAGTVFLASRESVR